MMDDMLIAVIRFTCGILCGLGLVGIAISKKGSDK